jgi:hypothetical protein
MFRCGLYIFFCKNNYIYRFFQCVFAVKKIPSKNKISTFYSFFNGSYIWPVLRQHAWALFYLFIFIFERDRQPIQMMCCLLRQMTCHLLVQILATTMVAEKTRQCPFLPKKFQFLSNFNAKNLTNTFKTPTNQLTNPKNPKQGSKTRNQTRLDLSSST